MRWIQRWSLSLSRSKTASQSIQVRCGRRPPSIIVLTKNGRFVDISKLIVERLSGARNLLLFHFPTKRIQIWDIPIIPKDIWSEDLSSIFRPHAGASETTSTSVTATTSVGVSLTSQVRIWRCTDWVSILASGMRQRALTRASASFESMHAAPSFRHLPV